jgi:hypothetical protein
MPGALRVIQTAGWTVEISAYALLAINAAAFTDVSPVAHLFDLPALLPYVS